MKYLLTFFLSVSFYLLNAQTIPVYTPKDEEVVKPKPISSKPNIANTKRRKVIPKFDVLQWDFVDGLARVKQYGKWGFINTLGEEVTKIEYDETWWSQVYPREKFFIVDKGGKQGFINASGEEICPIKYSSVRNFNEGRALVEIDNKYGYIDEKGVEITQIKYDHSYSGNSFYEGFAVVNRNGKYGYIDKAGNEAISLAYEDANAFSDGLAGVHLSGKYGFIDYRGRMVIECKYENKDFGSGGYFHHGLAAVKLNGKWGYVDKLGKVLIPFIYDEVHDFEDQFGGIKASVVLNGSSLYINRQGVGVEIN